MLQAIPTPEGFYVAPETKVRVDSSDWICNICGARVPKGSYINYNKGYKNPTTPYVDIHREWHRSMENK